MIDLTLTPFQQDLVHTVRAASDKEFSLQHGVDAALHGTPAFDRERWRRLAGLGCFALRVPEDAGGLGLGSAEEFLMAVELGRSGAGGPIIGTALAARVAVDAGENDLAGALTSGECAAGLLVGDLAVDAVDRLAVRVGPAGIEVVEVAGEDVPPADPLTVLCRVERSTALVSAADATAQSRLRLLAGGYLVGLADAAVAMAAEYAKVRTQFGKPIGAFQAVKHRCAEMLIRAHPASAVLSLGAALLDGPHGAHGAGALEIAGGCLMAADAAQRNAEDNVQVHGGIGFTAEHQAGVLLTRVQTVQRLVGPVDVLAAEVVAAERRRPE